MKEEKVIKTFLERGYEEGHVSVLKNNGDVSEANGPGDVEVTFVSKSHPLYERDGDDLKVTINITLKESLFGFKRTIKGIDGNPLDIESNGVFAGEIVIPDRGLPKYMYPGMFGNVIVSARIRYPKELSQDQIEIIEKVTTASE